MYAMMVCPSARHEWCVDMSDAITVCRSVRSRLSRFVNAMQ